MALTLITADEVAPGPIDDSKPLTFETQNGNLRETYSQNRQDKMHFRLVDPDGNETRLFSRGRPDDARECTTQLNDSRNRSVIFGGAREDGCIEYKRSVSKLDEKQTGESENNQCIMYGLKFSGRSDGVHRVALSLRNGMQLDHGQDTPAILFRDKIWHAAIVCDPCNKEHWDGIAESYYSMEEKNLRVVVENTVSGEQKQESYSCMEPNNDPIYERARFAIMTAVELFINVERDLFLHLPMFVPGTSESSSTAIQNKRLEDAMQHMYKKLDGMSSEQISNPMATTTTTTTEAVAAAEASKDDEELV